MSIDLAELYEDMIKDHSRRPRNFGEIEKPSHFAHGNNPLCGDQVTIFVETTGDKVSDVRFKGRGCALSMAAASLMTETIKGKSIAAIDQLFQAFRAIAMGTEAAPHPEDLDEDIERYACFKGVRKFPVRVKCATLPWHALEAALKSGAVGATVKTE
ncbi:MAG: SUF system NifU family Fe-S cluster assembly protein [Alphaproteobacteria bacterium]|nr:SUF system NifU family Fe-S cluster assembly protein [Alphaproteobacteria bacterium]